MTLNRSFLLFGSHFADYIQRTIKTGEEFFGENSITGITIAVPPVDYAQIREFPQKGCSPVNYFCALAGNGVVFFNESMILLVG